MGATGGSGRTTSYGYRPPRGARFRGWQCPGCGRAGDEAPRRWPPPCPECAEPVDPVLDEPWSHDAEGYRLRHQLRAGNRHERMIAEAGLPRWQYADAVRAGDPARIVRARIAFHEAVNRLGRQDWGWPLVDSRLGVVATARNEGDLGFAADVLLGWYPAVDTHDLENDSDRRTEARIFVHACTVFLDGRDAIGHPREAEVMRAMRDVATRAEDILTGDNHDGMQRVMHLRAVQSDGARFPAADRSPNLPPRPFDSRPRSLADRILGQLRPRRAQSRSATGAYPFTRVRDWQRAARRLASAPIEERTRLANAWVGWALGTDRADLVADAYAHLVTLVPAAVAAGRGTGVDDDVLLRAAQEHVEEAGYWLCRAGRYRAAAITLETGRAVALSVGNGATPADVEYGDVVTAGDDGAVLYVAAAKAGGYALVVAGRHDPQYVELRRYDRASVMALLDGVLPGSARPARGGRRDVLVDSTGEEVDASWDGVLAWLWRNGLDNIMIQYAHGRMVTLVPIGLLGLLPLHAAGVSSDRHAGMFSAVRYAPNVRTLDRCRAVAAACGSHPSSLFVADVPDGHGLPPSRHLHHAGHETSAIAQIWTDAKRAWRLQHSCRWADFRRQADGHSVWHIACHGGLRASAGLGGVGALSFADAEVGIEQFAAELRHAPRRLAILSACETHLTSASLPNETIGLPSALLRLGFAGVIATTWKIDDAATPYLMAYFHRIWCADGGHPAVALNRAQRWLARASRAELGALLPAMGPIAGPGERPFADPLYWAGFAYTGA